MRVDELISKTILITSWTEEIMELYLQGCTDFRISVSIAKFDADSDFEVRSALAPQKTWSKLQKLSFRINIFVNFFCWRWTNEMSGIV